MTAVGGPDTDENTVLLTPREHYIVHSLLWKLNPGNKQFRDPIFTFKNKGANNSRVYEAARIEHVKYMKEHNPSLYLSEESKASKSRKLKLYAKNRPIEHNAKISQASKGKQPRLGAVLTTNSKAKISESLKEYYAINDVSQETREKIRLSSTGRKHNAASVKKMKNAALARPRWPHPDTNKMYDAGNLTQVLKREGWTNERIKEYKNTVEPTITTAAR
jgi:hypothetical protein